MHQLTFALAFLLAGSSSLALADAMGVNGPARSTAPVAPDDLAMPGFQDIPRPLVPPSRTEPSPPPSINGASVPPGTAISRGLDLFGTADSSGIDDPVAMVRPPGFGAASIRDPAVPWYLNGSNDGPTPRAAADPIGRPGPTTRVLGTFDVGSGGDPGASFKVLSMQPWSTDFPNAGFVVPRPGDGTSPGSPVAGGFIAPAPVPEPATILAWAGVVAGIALVRRARLARSGRGAEPAEID